MTANTNAAPDLRDQIMDVITGVWDRETQIGDAADTVIDLCALSTAAQRSPWAGGEEWEPLAYALCAEEHGDDACHDLIWEGGPIPEPWGDRWMKYESEAKRLIGLVRTHVPSLAAAQPPAGWVPVPVELAERVQETMGEFLMDHGWRQIDMDTSDDFGALLAAAPKAHVQIPPENVHVDIDVTKNPEKVDTSAAPKAERAPLTERQIVKCLVEASCVGTVKMSFESGPYDIDRPSINATRLVDAIEREHGIQPAHKEQP